MHNYIKSKAEVVEIFKILRAKINANSRIIIFIYLIIRILYLFNSIDYNG